MFLTTFSHFFIYCVTYCCLICEGTSWERWTAWTPRTERRSCAYLFLCTWDTTFKVNCTARFVYILGCFHCVLRVSKARLDHPDHQELLDHRWVLLNYSTSIKTTNNHFPPTIFHAERSICFISIESNIVKSNIFFRVPLVRLVPWVSVAIQDPQDHPVSRVFLDHLVKREPKEIPVPLVGPVKTDPLDWEDSQEREDYQEHR